jgi:hypothetical protein
MLVEKIVIEKHDGNIRAVENNWTFSDDEIASENYCQPIEEELSHIVFDNLKLILKNEKIRVRDIKSISFVKIKDGEIC